MLRREPRMDQPKRKRTKMTESNCTAQQWPDTEHQQKKEVVIIKQQIGWTVGENRTAFP